VELTPYWERDDVEQIKKGQEGRGGPDPSGNSMSQGPDASDLFTDKETPAEEARGDADGVLPSLEELELEHYGQLGQIRADIDSLVGLVGDLIRRSRHL
jgi:hypothetical protein